MPYRCAEHADHEEGIGVGHIWGVTVVILILTSILVLIPTILYRTTSKASRPSHLVGVVVHAASAASIASVAVIHVLNEAVFYDADHVDEHGHEESHSNSSAGLAVTFGCCAIAVVMLDLAIGVFSPGHNHGHRKSSDISELGNQDSDISELGNQDSDISELGNQDSSEPNITGSNCRETSVNNFEGEEYFRSSESCEAKGEAADTEGKSGHDHHDCHGRVSNLAVSLGHDHHDCHEKAVNHAVSLAASLFVLSVHSFIEGLVIGITGEVATLWILTGTVLIHKSFLCLVYGMELCIILPDLKNLTNGKWMYICALCMFILSTPLAVISGYYGLSLLDLRIQTMAFINMGAAGLLLATGTESASDMVEHLMSGGINKDKLIWLIPSVVLEFLVITALMIGASILHFKYHDHHH